MTVPVGTITVSAERQPCERRKAIAVALCRQVVDGHVLPIGIPNVAQALEECLETVGPQRAGIERKEAQPRNVLGFLPTSAHSWIGFTV